jgi:hypothetical protein
MEVAVIAVFLSISSYELMIIWILNVIFLYYADWGDCKIAMQFCHILMSIPNNAFQKCLVILLVKLAFSSP